MNLDQRMQRRRERPAFPLKTPPKYSSQNKYVQQLQLKKMDRKQVVEKIKRSQTLTTRTETVLQNVVQEIKNQEEREGSLILNTTI